MKRFFQISALALSTLITSLAAADSPAVQQGPAWHHSECKKADEGCEVKRYKITVQGSNGKLTVRVSRFWLEDEKSFRYMISFSDGNNDHIRTCSKVLKVNQTGSLICFDKVIEDVSVEMTIMPSKNTDTIIRVW